MKGSLINYVSYNYVDKASNPKSVFVLPDDNIDTNTIQVSVSPAVANTSTSVYNKVTDILDVSATSEVYFLEENRNGKYQIYFGNDIVGKALPDGATIAIRYLITNGTAANKANNFVATATLTDSIGNSQTNFTVSPVSAAAGGATRETVDSIKYSAAAQYATQNRLVTVKDYESYIKSKYPSIDSLSVWGGETETPKVFGKVYIALKPKQIILFLKQKNKELLMKLLVQKLLYLLSAEIRDPQYLYLIVESRVQYDPKKTSLDEGTIRNNIRQAILDYRDTNLNKFAGTFVLSKLQDAIDSIMEIQLLVLKLLFVFNAVLNLN
jgi:hypothetical protein